MKKDLCQPCFKLEIEGMMCQQNCATTVQKAIKSVNNVTDATVTYSSKEAVIWGQNVNFEEVRNAIEDVGYEVVISTDHIVDDFNSADVTLFLKGMFNELSCPDKVKKTLLAVDGVTNVSVDFAENMVSVWGFADMEAITSALTAVGYSTTDFNNPSKRSVSSQIVEPVASKQKPEIQFKLGLTQDVSRLEVALRNIHGVESVDSDIQNRTLALRYSLLETSVQSMRDDLSKLQLLSAVSDSWPPLNVACTRREVLFEITGMSCANCALKIERYLAKCPGVLESGVSCMTNKARVVLNEGSEGCIGPRDLCEHIQNMGYGCELADLNSSGSLDKNHSASNSEFHSWQRLLVISLVLGVPVMCLHLAMATSDSVMMMSLQPAACADSVNLGQMLMICLNAPLLLLVGYRYYKAAILGALHCTFGMDCLVVTGTSITFLYSCFQIALACHEGVPTKHVFFETTGMLLMFVTIGKFIEAYAKGKSVSAVTNLLKLQPREALLVTQQASPLVVGTSKSKSADLLQQAQESLKSIHVDLVQRGDLLKVLPGGSIPTDGCVEFGSSYVDESMITGESVAVMKGPGDLVFGSTVNQNNCIYIRVTSLGSESALAQIVKLVEAAQMSKAPVQALADRVAGIFTPIILLLASLTFVVWLSLSSSGVVPASWFRDEYDDPLLFSMLFAISVVVISCPCALGLATPTAIMVGTAVGAANGILIKGGEAFEMAHKITTVIFDKTGTLTEGRPSVTDEILLVEPSCEAIKSAVVRMESFNPVISENPLLLTQDVLLWIAACAEQMSEHPLARALLQSAKLRGLLLEPLGEDVAVSHVGSGVRCISGLGTVLVGNRSLMEASDVVRSQAVEAALWDLEVQGKTAVCVALNNSILGVLGIADVAKSEARSTIRALHGLNIDVWMLTGDSRTTAEALAEEVGIPKDRVLAGALPVDKVDKVRALQDLDQFVAMVGDGVNDSPALAQADLGVAIGTGTQVAIEAADMVLIRNHLHDLVVALDLAKVVFARIRYNFAWAMIYNVVSIPYAAGCFFWYTHLLLPPQYAGLAMAMSSISVVMSSMALRFYRRPMSLLQDDHVLLQPTVLQKATRQLMSIKDGLKETVKQVSRRRSGGPQYQQLARDEQEADQSLGLELGLGGMGGLVSARRSSSHNRESSDYDDVV